MKVKKAKKAKIKPTKPRFLSILGESTGHIGLNPNFRLNLTYYRSEMRFVSGALGTRDERKLPLINFHTQQKFEGLLPSSPPFFLINSPPADAPLLLGPQRPLQRLEDRLHPRRPHRRRRGEGERGGGRRPGRRRRGKGRCRGGRGGSGGEGKDHGGDGGQAAAAAAAPQQTPTRHVSLVH